MSDLEWTPSEKKIARRAYENALDAAFARILTEFKAKAAQVAKPSEMWDLEEYLRRQRKHIDTIFDYQYSQLIFGLAVLIRESYLDEGSLAGLSEEKLEAIRRVLRFAEG
jgi:predicted membrane metal-binding protein